MQDRPTRAPVSKRGHDTTATDSNPTTTDDSMSLDPFGPESTDALFQALDDVHVGVCDVDDSFAGERTAAIALELAKAKKAISRAKELRLDDLEGSSE